MSPFCVAQRRKGALSHHFRLVPAQLDWDASPKVAGLEKLLGHVCEVTLCFSTPPSQRAWED